jgi:glycosyltransferase involved in cell wall biosynthesis
MKILFLSHYFPPEVNAPASRTFEHGRAWAQQGHDVTIVTCAPNHPTGVVYPGYRNSLWQEERVDGMRIIRLWTYLAANQGFARRIANYVSYMVSALVAAPFLPAADVVISTSPQFFCGLAGYGVSRVKRAPWVLEIRDLWPDTISAVGAIRSRRIIRFLEGIETWAYRKADKVVAVTNAFRDHIEARGVPRANVQVIRNGVDLSLFQPRPKDESLARELGLQGKFVAAYVGTHGMCHKLETVLEAAKLVEHDHRIAFLLVGSGGERAHLLDLKDRMGLTNVAMLDQQPKERMPRFWGLTDVALVLLARSDLFKTVVPSKIFEAMAMERPIILGVEGESRAIIEEAEAGLAVTPESAEEVARAIMDLAGDPKRASELGRNGRRHVEKSYDRRVLAQRFEGTLAALLSEVSNHPSTERLSAPTHGSDLS